MRHTQISRLFIINVVAEIMFSRSSQYETEKDDVGTVQMKLRVHIAGEITNRHPETLQI
jgi:hypothetical protein